jgi:hypothetical protein
MTVTPAAARLISMLRSAGARDYDMSTGRAVVAKMTRLRLRSLQAIAVEHDRQTPNVWLDARFLSLFVRRGMACERYEASRGRHSNLAQIREFRGTDLVKIGVDDPQGLVDALAELAGSGRSA